MRMIQENNLMLKKLLGIVITDSNNDFAQNFIANLLANGMEFKRK